MRIEQTRHDENGVCIRVLSYGQHPAIVRLLGHSYICGHVSSAVQDGFPVVIVSMASSEREEYVDSWVDSESIVHRFLYEVPSQPRIKHVYPMNSVFGIEFISFQALDNEIRKDRRNVLGPCDEEGTLLPRENVPIGTGEEYDLSDPFKDTT